MLRPRKFKDLEKKLGHRFKDSSLIERALTHASVRGGKADRGDNERLEFVGDRVLGLAIAEVLSAQHQRASFCVSLGLLSFAPPPENSPASLRL